MKNTILLILIIFSTLLNAQKPVEHSESFQILYATVFDGDTIPVMNLPEASVIRYKFETGREQYLYNLNTKRVEKVYPYYEIALKVMDDLELKQQNSKKREFNKFKRRTKKEMMKKFEKELRDLSMSEGKILVKMINRRSESNFNDLIKEYFNPVKVWAYNIVAKKYDYDLKAPYDSKDPENKLLEMVFKAKDI